MLVPLLARATAMPVVEAALSRLAKRYGEDRVRLDAVTDPGSHFIYLRDVRTGAVWSATYQPTRHTPDLATMVAAYNHMNRYGQANGMELSVPA